MGEGILPLEAEGNIFASLAGFHPTSKKACDQLQRERIRYAIMLKKFLGLEVLR